MGYERQPRHDPVSVHTAAELAATSQSGFFSVLPHADLEAVLERCRAFRVRRGDVLLRPGDDAVLLLIRGAAMASASTQDGHRSVLAFVEPNQPWGLAATLGRPDSFVEVTALTETAGLLIAGRDLRRLINDRPTVARAALRAVVDELAEARAETARLSYASATERIVQRILELCDRWGRVVDDRVEVTLPLTQVELASWAHTSREFAAKALHELRRAGLIETGRRELVVLDPERLATRVGPSPGSAPTPWELLLSLTV